MIDERELREMLERRAATISATPTDVPRAIRRARRRLVLNAAAGTLLGLALLAGALAGMRTIQAAPTPANTPTPTPTPAPRDEGSLAYAVDGDVYVADWDGSNAVRIADGRHGCGYWGEGPLWSPDGRYLAYRHDDCQDARGRSSVVISDPKGNIVASFPGEGWLVSWSPDSTRVAVWVRLWQTIGIFGLDGKRQALLTMPPGWEEPGDVDPVWLPDAESLLVPPDLVIPIDGSTARRLPWTDHHSFWLTYSPDGSHVAYAAHKSLVVAEADGANPHEVVTHGVWRPIWSPTGDGIAFNWITYPSAYHVGVIDVATGTVKTLAQAEGKDYVAALDFSRDGDRILFVRVEDKGASRSLWSVNVDGSDRRRLVPGAFSGDWTG